MFLVGLALEVVEGRELRLGDGVRLLESHALAPANRHLHALRRAGEEGSSAGRERRRRRTNERTNAPGGAEERGVGGWGRGRGRGGAHLGPDGLRAGHGHGSGHDVARLVRAGVRVHHHLALGTRRRRRVVARRGGLKSRSRARTRRTRTRRTRSASGAPPRVPRQDQPPSSCADDPSKSPGARSRRRARANLECDPARGRGDVSFVHRDAVALASSMSAQMPESLANNFTSRAPAAGEGASGRGLLDAAALHSV